VSPNAKRRDPLRATFDLADPPEVTSSERTVHAWPGGNAHLTCIVRASPRAVVSEKCAILHVGNALPAKRGQLWRNQCHLFSEATFPRSKMTAGGKGRREKREKRVFQLIACQVLAAARRIPRRPNATLRPGEGLVNRFRGEFSPPSPPSFCALATSEFARRG